MAENIVNAQLFRTQLEEIKRQSELAAKKVLDEKVARYMWKFFGVMRNSDNWKYLPQTKYWILQDGVHTFDADIMKQRLEEVLAPLGYTVYQSGSMILNVKI